MYKEHILKELIHQLDAERVLFAPEDLIVYAYDATSPAKDELPMAIVMPCTVEEVQEILKLASEYNLPIVARGSATGLSGGAIPLPGSILITFNKMNHILEIDEANLTALVEPGVLTGDFAQTVASKGLFYPPDPGSMAISTIGGNVATNAGGLRGLKYGVTGDYVSGLEVVLANGDLLETGNKCKKDVAGYNLSSLFVGSEGTLGIITKILLRLLPQPEAQRTAVAYFAEVEDAAQVVADTIAARILPVTLELLDNASLRAIEDFAHLDLSIEAGAMLLIEVDGYDAVLDTQISEIVNICQKSNATSISVAAHKEEAEGLKSARRSTLAALARRRPTTILEDVTVPRDKIPEMVSHIRSIAKKYNVEIAIFGHAGDGNLHPTGMTDARDKEELHRVETAFEEIFEAAMALGGTITGEHGVGIKKRHVLPAQVGQVGMSTMRAIKLALDPKKILNPGKVFEL